jgi:hypothetical protein
VRELPRKGEIKYTAGELLQLFQRYLQHCRENGLLLPNIAGFCLFVDIHTDTFYNWRKDEGKGLTEAIKKIEQGLEDAALQSKDTAKSIFYLKNKFGYRDTPQVAAIQVNNYDGLLQEISQKAKHISHAADNSHYMQYIASNVLDCLPGEDNEA